ncbi:MAG: hypothetical protein WC027_01590 [Candidatus Paceibacterota bacterium]
MNKLLDALRDLVILTCLVVLAVNVTISNMTERRQTSQEVIEVMSCIHDQTMFENDVVQFLVRREKGLGIVSFDQTNPANQEFNATNPPDYLIETILGDGTKYYNALNL